MAIKAAVIMVKCPTVKRARPKLHNTPSPIGIKINPAQRTLRTTTKIKPAIRAAEVNTTSFISLRILTNSSYSIAGSPVNPTVGGVRPAALACPAKSAATALILSTKGPKFLKSSDGSFGRTNKNSILPSREVK